MRARDARPKILIMRKSTVTGSVPGSTSRRPRRGGARHAIWAALACGLLLAATDACDADEPKGPSGAPGRNHPAVSAPPPVSVGSRPPEVGDRMWQRVPASSSQVVVVYGDSRDSPDSLLVLYERGAAGWERRAAWPAHNGRLGWTADHRMDDERTPVGVFGLTDAGGTLGNPGSRLPYWHDDHAFASTITDDAAHAHDFDYVIAINYNRLVGAPPYDWSRPEGVDRGGGIWLHLDHGDGTSACVTIPESGMRTLLRTLDPAARPVVVMGDRERLMS